MNGEVEEVGGGELNIVRSVRIREKWGLGIR